MHVGTKSVLFGAHCFLIHPFYVAKAWKQLHKELPDIYEKPNFQHYIAFFVHDLGYIGKPNMDGPEGEDHVWLGAKLMGRWFGKEWAEFCLYHSRFWCKKFNRHFSKLCVADKLSVTLEPRWLYLARVKWSGEVWEYMKLADNGKYDNMNLGTGNILEWYRTVMEYLKRWVDEHKDMKEDEWTGVK